ncbi:UNVERIFIED_CONTAM: DUF6012 family protein, partial [Pseudomonas aeruginosa]
MLIHFCPRLLTPAGFDLPCELIDIRIKEFDLHLLREGEKYLGGGAR